MEIDRCVRVATPERRHVEGDCLPFAACRERRIELNEERLDPQRLEFGRASIGAASWFPFGGLFGDPHAVPRYTARILKFKVPAKKQENAMVASGI